MVNHQNWTDNLKRIWCEMFHNAPMWPVRGYYECRTCHVRHAVRWEQKTTPEQKRGMSQSRSSVAQGCA